MRLVDKRWPWVALASLIFAAVMAFLHFMARGINDDFGAGFAIGFIVSAVIVLTAAGWRRGELKS